MKAFAKIAAFLIVFVLGCVKLQELHTTSALDALYFWGMLAIAAWWLIRAAFRRSFRPRRSQGAVVQVAIARPAHSPSVQYAIQHVPTYCRQVLSQWEVRQ